MDAPMQQRRALVIRLNPSIVAMALSAIFIIILQLMFFYKTVAIIVTTIASMATGAYIHKILETYRNIHYIFVQDKFDIMDDIQINGGERLRVDDIHIWSTTFKKLEDDADGRRQGRSRSQGEDQGQEQEQEQGHGHGQETVDRSDQ